MRNEMSAGASPVPAEREKELPRRRVMGCRPGERSETGPAAGGNDDATQNAKLLETDAIDKAR